MRFYVYKNHELITWCDNLYDAVLLDGDQILLEGGRAYEMERIKNLIA